MQKKSFVKTGSLRYQRKLSLGAEHTVSTKGPQNQHTANTQQTQDKPFGEHTGSTKLEENEHQKVLLEHPMTSE